MITTQQARAVGVSLITLALVFPAWHTYSIFLPYISDDLQWSRATVSAGLAVFILVQAVSAVLVGRLCDRLGTRRVVRLGSLLLALALGLCSAARQPWQLYLTFGALGGLGLAMSGWVPAVAIIARQFTRRVSTATGVASMGIGIGSLLSAPLLHYLILIYSWREAMLVGAAIVFLGVQVAAFFLPAPTRLEQGHDPSLTPLPINRILRLNRFWFVLFAFLCFSFGIQLLLAHQVAYLIDSAWQPAVAATVVALTGILSLPLRMLLGNSSDQIGREFTYSLGAIAMLGALVMLTILSGKPDWRPGLFLYAIFMATAYSTVAPVYPAVASDLFGGADYGQVFGLLTLGSGIGSTLGVYGGGLIFDTFESYTVGFTMAAGLAILATFFVWLAAPRHGSALVEQQSRPTIG